MLHGVRALDANIVGDWLDAICAVAPKTDPDTLARELRRRAEAISPDLAEHARQRLEDRIGVTWSDSPDGTGQISASLSPETLALLNAVLDSTVHVRATPAAPPDGAHDAFHDVLRHAADCSGLDLPSQGGCRSQITIVSTAAILCDKNCPGPGS